MNFYPGESAALFIDGPSLYATTRNLSNSTTKDRDIDYRKLLVYCQGQAKLVRAHYYSAILDSEEYSPLKPLTDWLAYNGFALNTKAAKEFVDSAGRRRIKGNMDVEIATDMLVLAATGRVEHMILFSGDADLRYMIEAVQRQGIRVTVVSSMRTNPSMIADELRRQADRFVELDDIIGNFTRARERT